MDFLTELDRLEGVEPMLRNAKASLLGMIERDQGTSQLLSRLLGAYY
jgi:hypothetical protein